MAAVLIPGGIVLLVVGKPARNGPLILAGVLATMVGFGFLVGAASHWSASGSDGRQARAWAEVNPWIWGLLWVAGLGVGFLTFGMSTLAPSGWPQTAVRLGVLACWIPAASWFAARWG